jgi:two-component system sensor histidine kinase VicK
MQNPEGDKLLPYSEIEQALSLLPVPVTILKGPEHMISFANQAMLSFWRRPALSELIGRELASVFPEKDSSFFNQLGQVLMTGETYRDEEVLLTLNDPEGRPYTMHIDYTYQALQSASGEIIGVIVTAQDVGERLSDKQLLLETSRRLEQSNQDLAGSNAECLMAIETANLGTWKLRANGTEFVFSDRAAQMLGLIEKHIPAKRVMELVDQEYRPGVANNLKIATETGKAFDMEYTLHPADGAATRWIRASGRSVWSNTELANQLSGTFMDITEQKMEVMRKNQFIGMVSHELKTPLTSLSGAVQLLMQSMARQNDVLNQSLAKKCLHQIQKMTAMINRFLTISRLESGKFDLQLSDFDMGQLMTECLDDAVMTSPGHHFIQQHCDYQVINADRAKIAAVIFNLLSNAVKYSPPGSTVHVSCHRQAGEFEVRIRDQGTGISTEDQERVFERFNHVENHHVRNANGFGIGLFLSAEIIRHHQGRIWVERNQDAGCTFLFSLPLDAGIN